MHIIVVADHRSAPRSFTLHFWHLAVVGTLALCGLAGLIFGAAAYFDGAAVSRRTAMPAVSDVGPTLNMMAVKLGEMEAQLLRLDTFSDRLSTLISGRSGGRRAASAPVEAPASGEPRSPAEPHAAAPNLQSLSAQLARVAQQIEDRSSRLNRLESEVVDARAEVRTLPTIPPVAQGYHSSDYGARSDPFNGESRFHEGIDFVAPAGTAFSAAATGVVTSARPVPEYGNMIEIDHGNGLSTRYAHASRMDVREGEMVVKGQMIGLVGSTGRSTGPHLHFEVRDHGRTLNPEKFLRLAS